MMFLVSSLSSTTYLKQALGSYMDSKLLLAAIIGADVHASSPVFQRSFCLPHGESSRACEVMPVSLRVADAVKETQFAACMP